MTARLLLHRFLLAAGAVVFAAVAAAAAFAWQNHRRGDALVADVVALSRERARPVHRAPATKGSFEACLAPLIDQVADGGPLASATERFRATVPADERAPIDDVLDGGLAVEALPVVVQQDFERLEPWALAVSRCTHGDSVGTVEGIGPFVPDDSPRSIAGLKLQTAAKIGSLRIRQLAAAGQFGPGIERCLDILATARDIKLERGLIGGMLAVAIEGISLQSCGVALEGASRPELEQFLRELSVIRSSHISFGQILRMERVQMQLIAFGQFLDTEQLSRLPSDPRQVASGHTWLVQSRSARVATWLLWPTFLAESDQRIAAADGPERTRVFHTLDENRKWLAQIAFGDSPSTWSEMATRHDLVARGLDLLESSARVRLGQNALPGVASVVSEGRVVLSVEWIAGRRMYVQASKL